MSRIPVPPGRPEPVTDALLARLAVLARQAERGEVSAEGAELLLLCVPACLDELASHRRFRAGLAAVTNVVRLAPRNAANDGGDAA